MGVMGELYQLQLVDTELDAAGQRLAQIEANLGETDDVIRAREAIGETESSLERLRLQLRDLELEIASLNSKLRKNQDRLYSGRVRNPKELGNLQEEANALRRRQSELEDDQLELMILIEEDEAELAERQARSRQIETMWFSEQAALTSEREALESRLAELEELRGEQRARIGPGDLALYDNLRSRLNGMAVTLLKRGICQTCGVDVPTGVARSVERGEGLQYCPTCGRLMFGEK